MNVKLGVVFEKKNDNFINVFMMSMIQLGYVFELNVIEWLLYIDNCEKSRVLFKKKKCVKKKKLSCY